MLSVPFYQGSCQSDNIIHGWYLVSLLSISHLQGNFLGDPVGTNSSSGTSWSVIKISGGVGGTEPNLAEMESLTKRTGSPPFYEIYYALLVT